MLRSTNDRPGTNVLQNAANSQDSGPLITVRDKRLARGATVGRHWVGGDPFASAIFNSLSLSFPRGEAYFVESVRAFRDGTPDALAEAIRAFCAQEVNHSREHLAFNRIVAESGYALAELDAAVATALAEARERPAIVSLAATMALEHFTAMFAHELLANPALLEGADARLAELWRWHAIEEIEHKAVAYDTWLHATRGWSGWRRWKMRSVMMLLASRTFVTLRYRAAIELLRQDGITGWRAHWGVQRHCWLRPGLVRRILPSWIGYFRPGFHPWQRDDRALIAAQGSLAES